MGIAMGIEICASIVVPLLVSLITALVSYARNKKQCESNLEALQRESELSIRREALLFEYKRRFESIVDLATIVAVAVEDVAAMFPEGRRYELANQNAQMDAEHTDYLRACDSYDQALEVMKKHAILLPKELYEDGMALLDSCSNLIHSRFEMFHTENGSDLDGKKFEDCRQIVRLLHASYASWADGVRVHLDSRKYIENHIFGSE